MLTRALGISNIEQGMIVPDRLVRQRDAPYLELASSMLQIYEQGIGATREELHRRVERASLFIPEAPPRRIAAFCKLLDDRGKFDVDKRGMASKLRRQVFRLSAQYQPIGLRPEKLLGATTSAVREMLEQAIGCPWDEIVRRMYLDLPPNQTLLSFDSFSSPAELLARYNVAQAQVALFDASEMQILATTDFKSILKFVKLARLMHRVQVTSSGYLIKLDGPASLLQSTKRYGVAMAKLLPGLLSCRDWKAVAYIRLPRSRRLRWSLSSESGLTSPVLRPEDYDSSLEEDFFNAWVQSDVSDWFLRREATVLQQGQFTFVPDFTAIHATGLKVLIEIVGYWTPEYLEHKRTQLERFSDTPILILLPESSVSSLPKHTPHAWLAYKTKIPIPKVLSKLNSLASPPQ